MRNIFMLIVVSLAFSACETPSAAQRSVASSGKLATSLGTYEGTWEGTLTGSTVPDGDEGLTLKNSPHLRLQIGKGNVSVYTSSTGKSDWREIKPGKFQFTILDTNAVLFSISSGRDDDGTWVETWSFAITVVDATHLHVLWQRQVRNKDMDLSKPDAVFGIVAFGQLVRVPAA